MRQKVKIIFIVGLGVLVFGISCKKKDYAKELDDYFAQKAPQRAVEKEQIDKPISNFKDKISEMEIGSLLNLTKINPEIDLSWRILKISGVIENTGNDEIIDATIVCELLAESGTKLGADKVVIYQKFPPHQKKMFANIRMSMIPAQSHHANCFIAKAKFSTSN